MTEPQSEPTITAYDERGRELKLDREVWRRDVLPANLERAWDNAGRLYSLILMAIEEGLAEDVLSAARRLDVIDPMPERAACIHAIGLMQLTLYDQAAARLEAFIAGHGETGVALTNLAKTHSFRGDETQARSLLRRALALDPNQENGLNWWLAIHRDEGGGDALRTALEDIDREPGSWRPKLGLARLRLANRDWEGALALYRDALAIGDHPDAFHQASGDLGEAGRTEEMVALIEPLYDLERHGPMGGLNLVRAYAALGRIEAGRALWRRLKALEQADLDSVLFELEQLLNRRPASPEPAGPIDTALPTIDGPVWLRGLENPGPWLLGADSATGVTLRLLPFTLSPEGKPKENQSQLEDQEGRLSRALPLFLAEMLAFHTTAAPATVVPVVMGTGPIVTAAPWPLERLLPGFGKGGPDWLALTGRMPTGGGFAARLEVDIWNGATGAKIATVKQIARAGVEPVARMLAEKVQAAILQTGLAATRNAPTWFAPPAPDQPKDWLVALGQLLALLGAVNKVFPADRLWNEHGIFELHFQLAERHPGSIPAAILALTTSLAGLAYGSPVVGRYLVALNELLARHKDGGDPIDRLSPLVHRALGKDVEFRKARERLGATADPAYRRWLEGLG